MKIEFSKYQGTGNDFILIDNRNQIFDPANQTLIEKLCDRKFGIGADGLMLLQRHLPYDFEMVYFNSDGRQSSMCGNGGRCIVKFAHDLKIIQNKCRFLAIDGEHDAIVNGEEISLKMNDVDSIEINNDNFYLNTGSPHYVKYVKELNNYQVFNEGKAIRYNDRFKSVGTNVNFIEWLDDHLFVRTYERGVEGETLSCGTGVTAAALAASIKQNLTGSVKIKTLGGNLKIKFNRLSENKFNNIWLEGPATFVFKGEIEI